MTREEARLYVGKMTKYYGDKMQINQDRFDIWFDCIKDLRIDVANKAFTEYVKTSKFPPTVADIREQYDALWNEYMAIVRHVRESFDRASSYWPGGTDEQRITARKIFESVVGRESKDQRERVANDLANKAIEYVKKVEAGTDNDIISIDEYMRRVEHEYSS